MIGTTLGRYRIVSQLGRGAMGTVYQALDPLIERKVAIKTLNPDLPQETLSEMRARFVREAKSAGRLNHPNVVTIYDVGVAGDVAYIAMEFLEGQSLRQMLDSGAALPFDRIADIAAQIAEGLDYAGRFGIVHRDIKPANIMLLPNGLAKLTDFGVAHVPSSEMTQTGTALGSPKYMSPEQVLGQPVDPRADIFSLGIVLYEMLMRTTPFERPEITVYALMEQIVKQPAPKVSELNPQIPAAFDAILAKALAKSTQDRFPQAREFAGALRNLAAAATDAPGQPQPEVTEDDPEGHRKLAQLIADLEKFSREREHARPPDAAAAAALAAESSQALSEKLRQGYYYLRELLRQINEAAPAFTVTLDLIYAGRLPPMTLGEGAIECRAQKTEAGEILDSVTLGYRMRSERKLRVALDKAGARALKEQLGRAQLKFDDREVESGSGAAQFDAFVIECDIAANATLRADYAGRAVEISCQNVGVLGPTKYRLGIADFDESISEFGRLLLGFPSQFAGLRLAVQPG